MKILFIHEVSYTKKVIFEMHEFPELLALRGHDVSFFEFDEGRKFWDRITKSNVNRVSGRVHTGSNINISRPFQLGAPGLDRILAVFTVISALRRLLRANDFDVIVLYAVPTFGIQTIKMARRAGIPVVFRALDVSHKIRSSWLSPFIKLVEKFVYRNADLLSANNQAMADYCNQLSGRTKATEVHYPPLDLEHFKNPVRDPRLAASLGIAETDKVITYMGSFFYFSGLKVAIEEFSKYAGPDQKLLLIGGGEQDKELREKVRKLELTNRVIFTGFVPYAELPKYLSVADVAINTLQPTLVANVAFPNKVLQYMAAGLPVVSTKLNGLEQTFGERASITWASDSRGVIRAALKLSQQATGDRRKISELQLGAVSETFGVASAVDDFEQMLITLTTGGTK
jgi:glycosyltransferase involved in cell wall biosynthesis